MLLPVLLSSGPFSSVLLGSLLSLLLPPALLLPPIKLLCQSLVKKKKKIFVGVFFLSSHNVKGTFVASNCGPIKTDLGLAGCHLSVSLVITLNAADCSGLSSRKDVVIRRRKKNVDFVTMVCRMQRQQILRWTRRVYWSSVAKEP